jgi:hypothetical protein
MPRDPVFEWTALPSLGASKTSAIGSAQSPILARTVVFQLLSERTTKSWSIVWD